MNDGTLRLVVFSFVLSILFPMFAYTFTTFGVYPEQFDMMLDVEQLENAGIKLSEYETHDVTFGGAAQEYTVKNTTMRVKWMDTIIWGDYFANQQQSVIEKVLGTWIYPIEMDLVLDMAAGFILGNDLTNSTVVLNFNSEYNWTKYSPVQNSLTVFITTLAADDNNITKAIYETGTVTVTVASQVFGVEDHNLGDFGNWYLQIVTGNGGDWGLPPFLSWIISVFSFITLLAGVLLVKEFIPFLN